MRATGGLTVFAVILALTHKHSQVEGASDVDGTWSPWSTVKGFCVRPDNPNVLVDCGGGVMTTYRSCTNPAPQGNGVPCAGKNTTQVACNTNPCSLPIQFMWSEWSDCSNNCGRGSQKRFKMCGGLRQRLPQLMSSQVASATLPPIAQRTIPPEYSVAGGPAPAPASAPASSTGGTGWINYWELETSYTCTVQPPLEADPTKNQTVRNCNSWSYYPDYPNLWNHTNCPDPCIQYKCPKYASCDTLLSTTEDAVIRCACQMGTVMKADNGSCIPQPATTPTPRPIPTLPTPTKMTTGALSRSASTILIIFLSITIGLFLILCIFDPYRVVQMCQEISLLLAHLALFPVLYGSPVPFECRLASILIHYFYTVCFTFLLLEAVQMYTLIGSVVKDKGMLTTKQNLIVGWLTPGFIVLINMCFDYNSYGSEYTCWLMMDTGLLYGQYLPITIIVIITFTMIEAAGVAEEYPKFRGYDEVDRTTAFISQKTLIIILSLVFASFVTGTIAEYEQSVSMYFSFTIINGVLGGAIFFFHVTSHPKTRALVSKIKEKLCKKKN